MEDQPEKKAMDVWESDQALKKHTSSAPFIIILCV